LKPSCVRLALQKSTFGLAPPWTLAS